MPLVQPPDLYLVSWSKCRHYLRAWLPTALSVSALSSIWSVQRQLWLVGTYLQVKIALSLRDVIHGPLDALLGRYIHDNRDNTSALRSELVWGPMDAGGCFQNLSAAAGDVDFASVGGQSLG